MEQLRRLVAGSLVQSPGFRPWAVHVRIVVVRVEMEKTILSAFRFPLVNFHSFAYHPEDEQCAFLYRHSFASPLEYKNS